MGQVVCSEVELPSLALSPTAVMRLEMPCKLVLQEDTDFQQEFLGETVAAEQVRLHPVNNEQPPKS